MKHIDLYYAIDDSGKIDDQFAYSVYAGILFLNSKARSNFIGKYSRLINRIKCNYCPQNKESCDKLCPEIKSHIIKSSDRRQLLNIIKKEYCFVSITNKNSLTRVNLKNKKSKRRFLDYSVKIAVKSTIKELIKLNVLSPNDDIHLVINIDNETRGTDGIYDLEKSIMQELYYGINKNNCYFPPIIKGLLKVEVHYRDSKVNYDVQGADILAGTLRRHLIHSTTFQDSMQKINAIANVVEIIPRDK